MYLSLRQRDAHLSMPVIRADSVVEEKQCQLPGELAELFLQCQSTLVTHIDLSCGEGENQLDTHILELSSPVMLNHVLILPLGARLGNVEGKTERLTSLEIWVNDLFPILKTNDESPQSAFLQSARNRKLPFTPGSIPGSKVYTPPMAKWKPSAEGEQWPEKFPDFLLTTRLTLRGYFKTLTLCVFGHLKEDSSKLCVRSMEHLAKSLPLSQPSKNPDTDIYFAGKHPAEDAQGRYTVRSVKDTHKTRVANLLDSIKYKLSLSPPATMSGGNNKWSLLHISPQTGILKPELTREMSLLMQAIQQSGRCPIEPMVWRFWDILIELINSVPVNEHQSRRAHFETTLTRWMADPALDSLSETMALLIQLIFQSYSGKADERLSTQSQERLTRIVSIYFVHAHRIQRLPDKGIRLAEMVASALGDKNEFKPRTLRTALLELMFVIISSNPFVLKPKMIEVVDGNTNLSGPVTLTGVDSQDVVDGLDCLKAVFHAKEAFLSRDYVLASTWLVALAAPFGAAPEDEDKPSDMTDGDDGGFSRRGSAFQQPSLRPGSSSRGSAPLWVKKSGTDSFLFVVHRLILGRYPDEYRSRDVFRLPPFIIELFNKTEFLCKNGEELDSLSAESVSRMMNYLCLNGDGLTIGMSDELIGRISMYQTVGDDDVSPLWVLVHLRNGTFSQEELDVLSSKPYGRIALSLYLLECSLHGMAEEQHFSLTVLLNLIEGLEDEPWTRRTVFSAILHRVTLWDEWFQSSPGIRLTEDDLELPLDKFLAKSLKTIAFAEGPDTVGDVLESLIDYCGGDTSYSTECDAAIRKAAGLTMNLEIGDIANAKTRVLGGFERGGRVVVPNVFCCPMFTGCITNVIVKLMNTILDMTFQEQSRCALYKSPTRGGGLVLGPLLHLEKFSLAQFYPPFRYLSPDHMTRLLGITRRCLGFVVGLLQQSACDFTSLALSLLRKLSDYGLWEKHREMDNDIWYAVKCMMIDATKKLNLELLEGCLQFLRAYIVQTHPTVRWWLFNKIVLELRGTVEYDKLCLTVLRAVYDDEMFKTLHPETSNIDWTVIVAPQQPPIMPNHVTPSMLDTQGGVLLCLSAPSGATRPPPISAGPFDLSEAIKQVEGNAKADGLRIAGETLEFDPAHRNISLDNRLYICAMLPSYHYKDINHLRISMLSDKSRIYSTSVFGGTVDIYDHDSLTWYVIKQLISKSLSDNVTSEFWQSSLASELSIEAIASLLDRITLIISDSNDESLLCICSDLLTVLAKSKLPITHLLIERIKMLVSVSSAEVGKDEYSDCLVRIERLTRSVIIALLNSQKGSDLSSLIHICASTVGKSRRTDVLILVILSLVYPMIIHQPPLIFSLLMALRKCFIAACGHFTETTEVEDSSLNDLELLMHCIAMFVSNSPLKVLLIAELTEPILDFVSPHLVSGNLEALGARVNEQLPISLPPPIGPFMSKAWDHSESIRGLAKTMLSSAGGEVVAALVQVPQDKDVSLHHSFSRECNTQPLQQLNGFVLRDIISSAPTIPLNMSRCLEIIQNAIPMLKEYKIEFSIFDSFFPNPTRWLLPPRYVAVGKAADEDRVRTSVDILARPLFHKTMGVESVPLIIPMESLEDPDAMEAAEDGNTRQKRSISAKVAKMATSNAQAAAVTVNPAAAAEDWTTYQYIASSMQAPAGGIDSQSNYLYDTTAAPTVLGVTQVAPNTMESWDQFMEATPQQTAWSSVGQPAFAPTILNSPPPHPAGLRMDELMEDPMCRELMNRAGFKDLIIDCAQNGINFVGLLKDPTSMQQNPVLYNQFLDIARNHELTHDLLRMSGIM